MSLKICALAALAAAALAVLLAPQTVGYASSGVVALAADDVGAKADNAPVQLDIPAGWQRVPASATGGELVALRCAAKGCIPGVTATLSCVSAEGRHEGASRELAALAETRPEIRRDRRTSEAAVFAVGGREFHELSSVLDNGRYVLTVATRVGGDVCGLGLTGPRSEGARLDLTIRSMLSRLRFS
ncbi:MAG: hypothetical protein NVSMB26_12470 [Beijerinckiaceae bacterium]